MTQTPTTPTPLKTGFFSTANVPEGLVSPIMKEEISTIFVVGFPEDMQEREFQNMFMFSPGFEAATLKIPLLTEEENNRKQIIGFAKFRTRKEAMDARDILNGRKVDAEKGCMLKAEMAKKNLHTKRGLLNEQKAAAAYSSLLLEASSQPQSPTNIRFPNHSAAFEAFHSVPPTDYFNNNNNNSTTSSTITRSQSVDASKSIELFMNNTASSRFLNQEIVEDYLSKSTPTTELTFRAMNSLLNNTNTNSIHHYQHPHSLSTSKSTGLSRVMEEKHQNNYHEPIITRFHPLNTSLSTPPKSSSPSPPGIISPTTSYRSLGGMLVGSSNPADQNPPCNTLYVGNLPVNTNEEELKVMFSKCPGYKRLSFRNKSNGPMCFVEFEDTIFAAQALQELHGNPLSNSVKGGIRLSFSKNPLGVRQNTNNNGFPLMNNNPPIAFNSRRESLTYL